MTNSMDDRSGMDSQGSQRLSTNMTGYEDRAKTYSMYLLKPENVCDLWESSEPNADAQKLILSHIEDCSEVTSEDWRTWDENEDRFEANELKWIADFVVRNLVFIRSDLHVTNDDTVSHLMQILWKALNLLERDTTMDLSEASQNRFTQLKNGLKRLFEMKNISKSQVQQVLDYSKRTIFGHL